MAGKKTTKKAAAAKPAPKQENVLESGSATPNSDAARDSSEDGSTTAVGMTGQRKAHPQMARGKPQGKPKQQTKPLGPNGFPTLPRKELGPNGFPKHVPYDGTHAPYNAPRETR